MTNFSHFTEFWICSCTRELFILDFSQITSFSREPAIHFITWISLTIFLGHHSHYEGTLFYLELVSYFQPPSLLSRGKITFPVSNSYIRMVTMASESWLFSSQTYRGFRPEEISTTTGYSDPLAVLYITWTIMARLHKNYGYFLASH